MIHNNVHFDKTFEQETPDGKIIRRYYFGVIPISGNWSEALVFAKEFLDFVSGQKEHEEKRLQEQAEAQAKAAEEADAEVIDPVIV